MPWFRSDDKFHSHRKTRRAIRSHPTKRRDAAAVGLWQLAGTWCSDNLTDGFVPADELETWDDDHEAIAERLVDAGFWEHAEHEGEPGYQFVNWAEHQPTKAAVEQKRAEARERMARSRERRREASSGDGDVRANTKRTSRAVRSPRPDPTRPDPAAAAAVPPRSRSDVLALDDLPGPLVVLKSKVTAWTVLQNVSFARLRPDQADEIIELIEQFGDDRLVDTARTAGQPPAYVQGYLDRWRGLEGPRLVREDHTAPRCPTCNRTPSACEAANASLPEADRCPPSTATRSAS